MPFFYQSGEQIEVGDSVLLNGETGQVELIADPIDDPNDWYAKAHGGGVMIAEPKVFGRLFLTASDLAGNEEDLEFVARGS
jgi:hypothetical protein